MIKMKNKQIHFYFYSKDELSIHVDAILSMLDELIVILKEKAPEALQNLMVTTVPHLPAELMWKINIFDDPHAWPMRKYFIAKEADVFHLKDWDSFKKDRKRLYPNLDLYIRIKSARTPYPEHVGCYLSLGISDGLLKLIDLDVWMGWFQKVCKAGHAHYALVDGNGGSFLGVDGLPMYNLSAMEPAEMLEHRDKYLPGCFWNQYLSSSLTKRLNQKRLAEKQDSLIYTEMEMNGEMGLWIQKKEDLFANSKEQALALREALRDLLPTISLAHYTFVREYTANIKTKFIPLYRDEEDIVNDLAKRPKPEVIEMMRKREFPLDLSAEHSEQNR